MTDEQQLTLGSFLRIEREKRGVTLEQVAASTKIGLRFLQLLEADQYDELPARPFIRGFVISYCRYLGLDSSDVLRRFSSYVDERTKERARDHSRESDFDGREAEKSRRTLWAIMGLFLAVGSGVLLLIKPKLKHRRVQHLEELSEAQPKPAETAALTAVTTPTATASPTQTPTPAAKPSPTPTPTPTATATTAAPTPVPSVGGSVEASRKPEAEDPLNKGDSLTPAEILQKIVVKTVADAWIRYRVDDRPASAVLLRAGSMIVMRASRVIRFEVADASVMTYRENFIGARPLTQASGSIDKTTHRTYVFPAAVRSAEGDPFPGSKPLPAVPPPTVTPDPAPTP